MSAAAGEQAPPPVERVLVWRHGRTGWNASGRFQGQLDPPLDDTGRSQARRAAGALARELPAGTLVVTSDLARARDTAQALADALGAQLRIEPRLREHGLGSWEGLTREDVARDLPEQYADWMEGRPVRGRGGEDPAAVARRALAALSDLPGGAGRGAGHPRRHRGPVDRGAAGPGPGAPPHLRPAGQLPLDRAGAPGHPLARAAAQRLGHRRCPGATAPVRGGDRSRRGRGRRRRRPRSVAGGAPLPAGATPDDAAPAPTDADVAL